MSARRWHRLYSTKLYIVEVVPHDATCSLNIFCDVSGCTVFMKSTEESPYTFTIITKDNNKHEFQAESEDEAVLWISAIRRCSTATPGRHVVPKAIGSNEDSSKSDSKSDGLSTTENGHIKKALLPPCSENDSDELILLRKFIEKNNTCCECNSSDIRYV